MRLACESRKEIKRSKGTRPERSLQLVSRYHPLQGRYVVYATSKQVSRKRDFDISNFFLTLLEKSSRFTRFLEITSQSLDYLRVYECHLIERKRRDNLSKASLTRRHVSPNSPCQLSQSSTGNMTSLWMGDVSHKFMTYFISFSNRLMGFQLTRQAICVFTLFRFLTARHVHG